MVPASEFLPPKLSLMSFLLLDFVNVNLSVSICVAAKV